MSLTKLIFYLQLLIYQVKCPLVIDSLYQSQNKVLYDEYCPKMQFCEEGAHVLCMYYNPDKQMGPRCYQAYTNVTMTKNLAYKLLEKVNDARSRVALGIETGKDGEPLPRAFGMLKLQWDGELATFAQILANQCVAKHDFCRATKRFPDPGQTVSQSRFTYPDWKKLSVDSGRTWPTATKISYAIDRNFEGWYNQKKLVTGDMITSYPDFIQRADNTKPGRHYLELIYSPATHMGCGVTSYVEFLPAKNRSVLPDSYLFNTVLVICNFSSRPRTNQKVYRTVRPEGQKYSKECGCPPGFEEDEGCLCTRVSGAAPTISKYKPTCANGECDPHVILFPIVSVENAPAPNSIFRGQSKHQNNKMTLQMKHKDSNHLSQLYPTFDDIIDRNNPTSNQYKSKSKNIGLSRGSNPTRVKSRYYQNQKRPSSSHRYQNNQYNHKRGSIFSRSSIFKKPINARNNRQRSTRNEEIRRRGVNRADTQFNRLKNEMGLNQAEEDVINDKYPRISNLGKNSQTDKVNYDTKGEELMTLLDTLEKEVQHIELSNDNKNILHAKISRIYKNLVGKLGDTINRFDNNIKEEPFPVKKNSYEDLGRRFENIKYKYQDDDIEPRFKDMEKQEDEIIKNNLDYGMRPLTHFENPYVNLHRRENKDKNNGRSKYQSSYDKYKRNEDYSKNRGKWDRIRERKRINKRGYCQNNLCDDENMDEDLQRYDRSYIRRKYYQNKLDNLENKLHNTRSYRNRNQDSRHVRPLQETNIKSRISQSQIDPFYLRDRARFLHGF